MADSSAPIQPQRVKHQKSIDPERLVFIDETWTRTDMGPLRGWAPCGQRLIGKVPHGRWKTMTFIAALRHDRIAAPWLLEGPIEARAFGSMSRRFSTRPFAKATLSS
jgi:hypothetical protein